MTDATETVETEKAPRGRAPMRDDDPRARAKKRAAELLGGGVMDADTTDEFYIDTSLIPDGWTYEWKRHSTLNAIDPAYQVQLAQMGWEPVPASRHPDLMPLGWKGTTIERKGMMLMERPEEITQKIRDRDRRAAIEPVKSMEEKLSGVPQGHFGRQKSNGESLVKVGKSFEPGIPVPD
jgi:hypothetical protein